MNSYFVKKRIIEKQDVKLLAVENGKFTHIIMLYPGGYLQSMEYGQFVQTLGSMLSLTPDNPDLSDVRREMEAAITHPIYPVE